MAWFQRKARAASIPGWLSFLTAAEYLEFARLISEAASRLGGAADFESGKVVVPSASEKPQTYGLQNLAQMFHQADPAERAELVADHFRRATSHDSAETRGLTSTYDASRPFLKVRLYPVDSFPPEVVAELIRMPVAEGLEAVLVHDLPETVQTTRRSDAQKWNTSDEELFAAALENVRNEPKPSREVMDLGKGLVIQALLGDSFFTASRILFLDELFSNCSRHGALAAVPHRHALLCHPIEDFHAAMALQHLAQLAHRMHAEGPGSVDPGVFWWRRGKIERLDARVTKKSVVIKPSNDFMDLLNSLGEPAT